MLLLRATELHKRLRWRRVLDGVTLEVRTGEIVGISGENGSGKTTLLRILAGVLRPDRGAVHRPVGLGYVPQVPLLYEHLTGWEHFGYVARARGLPAEVWTSRARALLDLYRFGQWSADPVSALSEGTRQKLNLALALLSEPSLVLLDEPYGGFEWETYLRFWDHARQMRDSGRAIVIVSHLFYDRSRLDRIVELRDGRVAE
jgi:ABC-2 type transport system ATP-binding protein